MSEKECLKLICLGQNVMVRSGSWKRGAELDAELARDHRPSTNHGLGSDCGNFSKWLQVLSRVTEDTERRLSLAEGPLGLIWPHSGLHVAKSNWPH